MQTMYNGYEVLLRKIFREDDKAPIRPSIIEGDTEVSLQQALNRALDTLPLTQGKNDSVRWQRIKSMIERRYGLKGNQGGVLFSVIGREFEIKEETASQRVRKWQVKLRESSPWLAEFFIQASEE